MVSSCALSASRRFAFGATTANGWCPTLCIVFLHVCIKVTSCLSLAMRRKRNAPEDEPALLLGIYIGRGGGKSWSSVY
jgi:hypothetical protein